MNTTYHVDALRLKVSPNTNRYLREDGTFAVTGIGATCAVTSSAEVADVIRWSIQVSRSGRWIVDFYITDSAWGDPNATGNTYALVTGTAWQTITANAAYTVLSDSTGLVQFDITNTAAITQHVYAEARLALDTGSATWAAAAGTPGQWDFSKAVNSAHLITAGII